MISLPISHSFRGAASLMGQPWGIDSGQDGIDRTLFDYLRDCGNRRLGEIWEAARWPQLTNTLRRRRVGLVFNSSQPYAVGTEVFHAATNRSYVCVSQTTPPWDNPGVTLEKWAELTDLAPIVTDNQEEAFKVGARVYWPGDGLIHYCKVDGALYSEIGSDKFYVLPEWHPDFPLDDPENGPMGMIYGVWERNPAHKCPGPLRFDLSEHGVRIAGDPGSAWVRYSLRRPIFRGAPLDLERTYTKGDGLYFENERGGDFYTVLDEVVIGLTPEDHPDLFEVIEVPLDFNPYLELTLHADWLRWDGQHEKAKGPLIEATTKLNVEKAKLARRQHQEPGIAVSTR